MDLLSKLLPFFTRSIAKKKVISIRFWIQIRLSALNNMFRHIHFRHAIGPPGENDTEWHEKVKLELSLTVMSSDYRE